MQPHATQQRLIIRARHATERPLLTDVALGAYGQHRRHILLVAAAPLHLHLGVVVHAVRVGEDAAPADDEARRAAAVLALALPREGEVGLGVDAEDLLEGAVRMGMEWSDWGVG